MTHRTTKHPQQLEGEVFYSNCDLVIYNALDFKTKRKGTIAISKDGKISDLIREWFPVFIKRSELIERGIDTDNIFG